MDAVNKTLPRFGQMHGWANRILRVDLSDMRIEAQEATPYVPDFLGARGIAAKIVWDEYPQPAGDLDPANPLMVFPGALTGSRSPYAGRTIVCAFSPQAYPHHWFTRSSIGGHFGGELKRAGYDGLIVTGATEYPVRISIRDDEVRVVPADELWGLDALDTLAALESVEGRGVQSLTIGPAGERLSRIATIQTGSSSACGQGGFGAVMGAKNLKAISVVGTRRVSLAAPETITDLARALAREAKSPVWFGGDMKGFERRFAALGSGRVRTRGCTEGCVTPCQVYLEDIEGRCYHVKHSGDWVCIGCFFEGSREEDPEPIRAARDWQLDLQAAFEMNVLTNRYGLNQFDIIAGMVPWLMACQRAGLISEMNGRDLDWHSPDFWADFLRAIAYREGLGDALAEGGWGAARELGMGEGLAGRYYPAWGHPSHWDGRNGWEQPFPYWIPAVLQWMSDTRDPISAGHGTLRGMRGVCRAWQTDDPEERDTLVAQSRDLGERVYGTPDAVDPYSGYQGKARVAHYHTRRPVIKDCVPVDDHCFPLIWNPDAPDRRYLFRDVHGVGDVQGPSVEYHLFVAGTGVKWSEQAFERAADRIHALERALQVRHWARDRRMDEMALPYFDQPESFSNPLQGGRPQRLDRERFRPVVDEFYTLHGWDPMTGWPTEERLGELGLSSVYGPMVRGANKVREKGPR